MPPLTVPTTVPVGAVPASLLGLNPTGSIQWGRPASTDCQGSGWGAEWSASWNAGWGRDGAIAWPGASDAANDPVSLSQAALAGCRPPPCWPTSRAGQTIVQDNLPGFQDNLPGTGLVSDHPSWPGACPPAAPLRLACCRK